ncbi:unnamed protein product, partial [Meganyctiphanes norvegica]
QISVRNSKGSRHKSIDDDSDPEGYEVEKILNHRMGHRGLDFLVKWKDFDEEDSTWEPKKNLLGCLVLVNEYLQNLQNDKEVVAESNVEQSHDVQFVDMSDPCLQPHYQQQQQPILLQEASQQQNEKEDDGFENLQMILEPETILKEEGVRVVEASGIDNSSDVQFVDMSHNYVPRQDTSEVSKRKRREWNLCNYEPSTTESVRQKDGVPSFAAFSHCELPVAGDIRLNEKETLSNRLPSPDISKTVHGQSSGAVGAKSSIRVNFNNKTMLLYVDPKSKDSNPPKNIITVPKPTQSASNKLQVVARTGSQKPRTIIPIENIQLFLGANNISQVSSTSSEPIKELSNNDKTVRKTINNMNQFEKTSEVSLSTVSKIINNNADSVSAVKTGSKIAIGEIMRNFANTTTNSNEVDKFQVVNHPYTGSATTKNISGCSPSSEETNNSTNIMKISLKIPTTLNHAGCLLKKQNYLTPKESEDNFVNTKEIPRRRNNDSRIAHHG